MACCRKVKDASKGCTSKFPRPMRVYCSDIFTSKTMEELEADSNESAMKKRLNWFDLTMLGIGAIIGSGIFVLTGQAAGNNAGPAIIISFIIAGVASGLAALCYSEMASMIPVAGSAYTYSYATMGEMMAWIIGWDLILEYLVGAAAVSVGWSEYVTAFIKSVGGGSIIHEEWVSAPFGWNETGKYFYMTGNYINVPAIALVMGLTLLLIVGIKESALLNGITVAVKVAVVLIFVFASIKFIDTANWKPFIPPAGDEFGKFGWGGILQATTIVFFAYIGFDALSTTAQECRNPQRDLPIGIISSLIICTVLYIAVCLCLTGIMPYYKLVEGANTASPIAKAAMYIDQSWLAITTEVGAIAGLTSVTLVSLLSQPRIFFSMARDGLLPACAARTHPRFGTPYITTLITGTVTAIMGGILPIGVLSELTSVGTLFAFVLVSLGVMILRIRRPDAPRKFKVPLGPYFIPILSALCSAALVVVSTTETKIRLIVWMAIGFIIYFAYGKRNSRLQRRLRDQRKQRHLGTAQNKPNYDNYDDKPSYEMSATVPVKDIVAPTAPHEGNPPPYSKVHPTSATTIRVF